MVRGWWVLCLAPALAGAAIRDEVIDACGELTDWQLGGLRINYVLGQSGVAVSAEQLRDGRPALKLTYDFAEPRRSYLSYYRIAAAIPGRCEVIRFQLHGNQSGCRLRLALEDHAGRWYQRDAGLIDWAGWREVAVPVADGEGWTPLLRHGEARQPLEHPIRFREIAVYRGRADQPNGAVFLQDLAARTAVEPLDLVNGEVNTGREANLFDLGQTPLLHVTLTNGAGDPVSGQLDAVATDFFGQGITAAATPVTLAPGATLTRELRLPTDRQGAYEATVRLTSGGLTRRWPARFGVVAPLPDRPADPAARFGCCANYDGFRTTQMPTVRRLNRDAGLRWARLGFSWPSLNPAPGRWAWDPPARVAGAVGRGLDVSGRPLTLADHPELDCPGGLTIACWAKVSGTNGTWQWVIQKPGGSEADRAWGIFFDRANGAFVFSAGYSAQPRVAHLDVSSGSSAWDNQWHHYAATYDPVAGRIVLYVDGQARTTREHAGGPLRANRGPVRIGDSLPGAIDELALYGRALTAPEVAALAGRQPGPEEGLLAAWSFDEEGPTIRDRSARRRDLVTGEPPAVALAREARAHGLEVLGLLGFPPAHASTAPEGAVRPWVWRPDLAAWAEYVEQTTRRYRDLCDHWELWNEPNISVFWEPEPNAREFWEVVRVGYAAAKRGNPDCTVITPGLAGPHGGVPNAFLDELLQLGAARASDALSLHPYRQATPEASDLVGDLQHIAAVSRANGGQGRLWFTEMCWTNQVPGGSTEARTALLLPRCYALSLGTGLVDHLIWFRLHDPGVDRFYTEHNYGLCDSDLTPKPAWFAHRATALALEGATPEPAWDLGGAALARVFRTPQGRTAVIWSPSGPAPVAIRTGATTVRRLDLMSNEATVATPDGVLLAEADEAAFFLLGLDATAGAAGALVEVDLPRAVRGTPAAVTVRCRNPFDAPRTFAIRLDAPPPLEVRLAPRLDLAARQTGEVRAMVPLPADLPAGRYPLRGTLAVAGQTLRLAAELLVADAAPDAGPVAVWHLDEGAGTRFADAVGPHHGTVAEPRWVPGRRGQALAFDGTPVGVVPDAPALNLTGEVTLACWFKPTRDTGTWQFPVTKYLQENVRRNWGLYLRPGTLAPAWSASYARGTSRHHDVPADTPLTIGQWHHLAASCSTLDGVVRLWVDGRQVKEEAVALGALLPTTDPVRLGGGTAGVLDEVMLWPRVLTDAEVADLAR